MSLKMSKQAIIELLNSNAAKYRKAHSRKAKGELLKQLMELSGYKSPKSIIRYFSRTRRRKRVEKRGRLPKLQLNDIELIKTIWLKSDQPCGKRLHPMLPTWLKAFSKRHEIDEESQRRILSVSPATLDRVLRDCKVDDLHKANKQTISALKQSIPIIDTTRKIDVAGHLYADTVAHCGDSTRGSFVWTLTVTDDLTLWTLNRAIWNKGQEATCAAFHRSAHIASVVPKKPAIPKDCRRKDCVEAQNFSPEWASWHDERSRNASGTCRYDPRYPRTGSYR